VLPGNAVSVPGLVGGAQSLYVGGAVEVCTAGGRVLTVTLNHPILTRQGWVAAGLLGEGEHVVVCTTPEWIASSVYPDYDHMPAAIEQVFGALKMSESVATSRVPVAPEDLHGDGRNVYGHINIVGPNRLLLGSIESRLLEAIGKIGLDGDSMRESALSSVGVLDFLSPGDSAPARRPMRIGDLIRTALGGHTGPFEKLGLGLGAPRHVGLSENALDDAPGDTRLAREFVLGFPSLIETDQIVSIRKFDFSGHVYDLQSGLYGLYTVNGILASNCRCSSSIRFETPDQLAEEFGERQAERERFLREAGLWREPVGEPAWAANHPTLFSTLGSSLRVEDYGTRQVREYLTELEMLPEPVLRALKDQGVKFDIALKSAPELDKLQHLQGKRPRGWRAGDTWDDVAGAYNPSEKAVVAGAGRSGSISTILHETGHAMGDTLGFNSDVEITIAHQRLFNRLNPYQQQSGLAGQQEFLAEGIAMTVIDPRQARQVYDDQYVDYLISILRSFL
jgi:hypothetical protein